MLRDGGCCGSQLPALVSEPHKLFDDRRDARQKFGTDGSETIDERLQMADVAEVIGKEVARFFSERFSDGDEVFDVQAAFVGFQSRQLRRRHSHTPRHLGLTATFRFTELPEDAAVHVSGILQVCCQIVNVSAIRCLFGKESRILRFCYLQQPEIR